MRTLGFYVRLAQELVHAAELLLELGIVALR
jgi:hypothetical protein